jgi:septum formation protein
LNIDFEVDVRNDFDESYDPQTPHERIPEVLSEGKSYGFHRELRDDEILITSDTLVLCGDRVMGKPHSREEAYDMLRYLSGRNHKVITAVTLRDKCNCRTCSDTAHVHFKELTDNEIYYYIDQFKPYDKAGAYGIQEWIGYIGIDKIEGSYFTIMGFPVHLVYHELLKFIG